MAKDLNQCNFIGRLGKDVEVRYTGSGDAVASFSIAVGWKTKDKEGAEWVNIVCFKRLAEICGEYLKKGSKVFVSGNFRTRKWQNKEGVDRYTTEIVCNDLQMLDSRGDKPQSNAPGFQPLAGSGPVLQNDGDDFDDDIPFR